MSFLYKNEPFKKVPKPKYPEPEKVPKANQEKMITKNKRGTHVGIILSFLIFVTFLAFLYSITEPATRVSRNKLDLLEYLKIELLNKFEDDMSTVTLTIIHDGTCGKFENFGGLEGLGAVVKNETGDKIASYVEINGDTEVSKYEGIMKFYYSNQFDKGESGCGSIKDADYDISIFRTTQEIFGSKINSISEKIKDDPNYYGELKEELGVPLDTEFGFTFKDGGGNILANANEKNVSVEVYAEEIPIQYMDSEANINPGFLNIRVW